MNVLTASPHSSACNAWLPDLMKVKVWRGSGSRCQSDITVTTQLSVDRWPACDYAMRLPRTLYRAASLCATKHFLTAFEGRNCLLPLNPDATRRHYLHTHPSAVKNTGMPKSHVLSCQLYICSCRDGFYINILNVNLVMQTRNAGEAVHHVAWMGVSSCVPPCICCWICSAPTPYCSESGQAPFFHPNHRQVCWLHMVGTARSAWISAVQCMYIHWPPTLSR